jgi:hypothetical protein
MKLFMVRDGRMVTERQRYCEVWKELTPYKAARRAFAHAAELKVDLESVDVRELVQPDDGKPGLCYEVAGYDHYHNPNARK